MLKTIRRMYRELIELGFSHKVASVTVNNYVKRLNQQGIFISE